VPDDFVSIAAVGDILVFREDPNSIFRHVRELLVAADATIGHVEGAPSDKGSRGSSGPRGTAPRDPASRAAIAKAGFDVVSLASNHVGDWGLDALADCVDGFRREGVLPVGAGRNLAEARTPVVVERAGVRIAVLAYCSVAPEGYYAGQSKHGCAPMRAITHYEPFEPDQPGNPAKIFTYPRSDDLDALVNDVSAAKAAADVVVVSMHWGVRRRAVVADYQQAVAHTAIDAGAEIIFGHHPHVLKGVEIYRGKAIFHSLGNFAVDVRTPQFLESANLEWLAEADQFYRSVEPPISGTLGLGSRQTIIAQWRLTRSGDTSVSFVPCVLNDLNEPIPVSPSSPDGAAIVEFVRQVTREGGFDTVLMRTDGPAVVVCPQDPTSWIASG
jgi:poly-gamma-glutamate capsule biosynthesis protein CapA/YwtB (metallophosphatase superfamily)